MHDPLISMIQCQEVSALKQESPSSNIDELKKEWNFELTRSTEHFLHYCGRSRWMGCKCIACAHEKFARKIYCSSYFLLRQHLSLLVCVCVYMCLFFYVVDIDSFLPWDLRRIYAVTFVDKWESIDSFNKHIFLFFGYLEGAHTFVGNGKGKKKKIIKKGYAVHQLSICTRKPYYCITNPHYLYSN